jgi:hypothetical protein
MIGMDEDAEPQPHDEWNYDLGSIQVYIYYMRGGRSGEWGGLWRLGQVCRQA